MLWVCLSSARTRDEQNRAIVSTCKLLEENWVQFAFQQTLEDKFTFQQDNNLIIMFLGGLVTVRI